MDDNYLQHWGILGQKWGKRRFQNPDGSLTEEGRKRYGVNGEKKPLNEVKAKPKTISEMTDSELKAYTNRLVLEKNAYEALNNWKKVNPPKPTNAEIFAKNMKEFLDNDIVKAISNEGIKWTTNYLNKKLQPEDPNMKLKQDAERSTILKTIAENNAAIRKANDNTKKEPDIYEEAKKEADYWTNLNKAKDQKNKYEGNGSKSKDNSKTEQARTEQARSEQARRQAREQARAAQASAAARQKAREEQARAEQAKAEYDKRVAEAYLNAIFTYNKFNGNNSQPLMLEYKG